MGGEFFGAIFLDFSKAYDRVNKSILCLKMHRLGVHPCLILSVDSWHYPDHGLPQGSPLSVILWLIYISDIPIETSEGNVFVDDSLFWISSRTLWGLEAGHQDKTAAIQTWCNANKILINPTKTHFIMNARRVGYSLFIFGSQFFPLPTAKYLGIDLTSSESKGSGLGIDVSNAAGDIKRRNSLILLLRSHLPTNLLRLFHSGLIVGKLSY